MGHHDARFGHQQLEPGSRLLHRFDSVMDEVDLSATPQFAQYRLSDEFVARSDDLRANGQAARRGGFDDREIAHARHGHLQGAGDGGGRERQDVNLGAELLQSFLMLDAEPLFLVDDHETQVAEHHILLDQPVGSDHHVDVAGRHVFKNGFGLLRRLEPGEQGHASREGREPFREVVEMLVGQQGRGDEHRHLAIGFHCLEGRPHGHFRFSVPDVAAHQSVHRFTGLHVVRNIFDRFELIRRFLILKRGFELVVHRAVESIGMACHEFAIGIQIDQLVGHLLDVLLHARGRFGPIGAAQTFKARRMAFRPAIPLHMVEPLQRDVQLVAAGEFQD